GSPVVPAIDFIPRLFLEESHELQHRPPSGLVVQTLIRAILEREIQMIQVTEKPSILDTNPIVVGGFRLLTKRDPVKQIWKINSCIYRQLKRSPESRVDLYEIRRPIGCDLELRHRDTVPSHMIENPASDLTQPAIDRDAFTEDA